MDTTEALRLDVNYTGVRIAASIFLVVSWIVFVLRVYVRIWMIRSFGRDDWFMLVTQVLFTVICALAITLSTVTIYATLATFDILAQYTLSLFCVYTVSAVTLKASVAFFFLRIVLDRWHRALIYAVLFANVLIGIAYFSISVFQCGDPRHYCENLLAGKCLSWKHVVEPMNYTQAISGAVTDCIFVAIPIYLVQSTRMSPRTKVSVITIIILAALGSLASVVRIAYLDVLGTSDFGAFPRARTYVLVTIVENGLCIIAASLATLKPLVTRFIDKYNSAASLSDPVAYDLETRLKDSLQKDVDVGIRDTRARPLGRDSKDPIGFENGLVLGSRSFISEDSFTLGHI